MAGLAFAATALAAPAAGPYAGATSQALPLAFRVSANGKAVTDFEPTFTARCGKAGAPSLTTPKIVTDVGPSLTVTRGVFSARNSGGTLRSGGQAVATVLDQVDGRFRSAYAAKGTYSVTLSFNAKAPHDFAGYRCRTGTLTWTANRDITRHP
jgi:hypothetical protein